jgi:predicted PurR-regulated permease PerM
MQNLGQYIDTAISSLVDWLSGEVGGAVSGLIESLISIVSFLFDFIVAIVVFVYALLEKQKFLAQSKKMIFALFTSRQANDILDVARYGNEVFGKFVTGKLITSTIVGVLTFLFMTIVGIPYALLSAGIIAITNIIPFFGPFIGGIPTAFIVIINDFRQGIIYIIFLLILQQVEGNVIEPMIMEDQTGVSKFWITFALLLCGGVFGVAGMIFAVPLFAVILYTVRIYVERSLDKKQLPISSAEYSNAGGIDIQTNRLTPTPEKFARKRFSEAVREWRERVKHRDDDDEISPE